MPTIGVSSIFMERRVYAYRFFCMFVAKPIKCYYYIINKKIIKKLKKYCPTLFFKVPIVEIGQVKNKERGEFFII